MEDHRPASRPDAGAARSGCSRSTSTGRIVGHDFVLSDRTVAAIRGAVERGVRVTLATGRMPSSAVVFAEPARADASRSSATRAPSSGRCPSEREAGDRRPRPASAAAWAGSSTTSRWTRRSSAEAVRWCCAHGLDPHVNHRERSSCGRTTRRSRTTRRTSARAPSSCRTSWRDPAPDDEGDRGGRAALPTALLPGRPAAVRGPRRPDAVAPAVPRVRRARRVEGPGGRVAGAPGRDPARAR